MSIKAGGLKTSREMEDQTKQNLDPSFKSFCVFPLEKQGSIMVQITLPLKF